jgi:hypothetical protein
MDVIPSHAFISLFSGDVEILSLLLIKRRALKTFKEMEL